MDEIGLLKVHCYLLCSMPSRLYSVPVNYQSRKFLDLIFYLILFWIVGCCNADSWVFSMCNVQTYKIRRLWSFLVAIIKKLAFGKLFMHFLLLSMNQNFSHLINWITQDAMGGLNLPLLMAVQLFLCMFGLAAAALVSYPGFYDFINDPCGDKTKASFSGGLCVWGD